MLPSNRPAEPAGGGACARTSPSRPIRVRVHRTVLSGRRPGRAARRSWRSRERCCCRCFLRSRRRPRRSPRNSTRWCGTSTQACVPGTTSSSTPTAPGCGRIRSRRANRAGGSPRRSRRSSTDSSGPSARRRPPEPTRPGGAWSRRSATSGLRGWTRRRSSRPGSSRCVPNWTGSRRSAPSGTSSRRRRPCASPERVRSSASGSARTTKPATRMSSSCGREGSASPTGTITSRRTPRRRGSARSTLCTWRRCSASSGRMGTAPNGPRSPSSRSRPRWPGRRAGSKTCGTRTRTITRWRWPGSAPSLRPSTGNATSPASARRRSTLS